MVTDEKFERRLGNALLEHERAARGGSKGGADAGKAQQKWMAALMREWDKNGAAACAKPARSLRPPSTSSAPSPDPHDNPRLCPTRAGDGELSKVELRQAVRGSLGLKASNAEVDRLFDDFDADGGGSERAP